MRWKLYIETIWCTFKQWAHWFFISCSIVFSIDSFIDDKLFESIFLLSIALWFFEERLENIKK